MSHGIQTTTSSEEDKEHLIIFDTTLRDGEQSPGVTLTADEKVEIAKQLSRLGVDVCEAGFPIASKGDFEAVRRVATEIGPLTKDRKSGVPMTICALARAKKEDIDKAYEAIEPAPRKRIHLFLATSDIHLQYKLKISREQCVQQVKEMVAYSKSKCNDVEFSPEDAGRSDREFLVKVLAIAIEAGATTLNIPDTVGYNTPEEFGGLIKYLKTHTPGGDKVIFSTHCHNDLGLAAANTLSGVMNGARQVEVTINGVGERAGNTALEEVVMTIYTHSQSFPVKTNIDTTQIMNTSRMVSNYMGMLVQPNKAIVGANAFAHESGIHQDGMLKHHSTYEIIRPEVIGLSKNSLVLGKHSGRHAFANRLTELGFDNLGTEAINKAFTRFKDIADSKKTMSDFDLIAIVKDELFQPFEEWKLNSVQVSCGDNMAPTATVSITTPDNKIKVIAAIGTGSVNAIYKAIDAIVQLPNILKEYKLRSITEGTDALGEVTVRISFECKGAVHECNGHGASPDILIASARAYISALNKLYSIQVSCELGATPVEQRDIGVNV